MHFGAWCCCWLARPRCTPACCCRFPLFACRCRVLYVPCCAITPLGGNENAAEKYAHAQHPHQPRLAFANRAPWLSLARRRSSARFCCFWVGGATPLHPPPPLARRRASPPPLSITCVSVHHPSPAAPRRSDSLALRPALLSCPPSTPKSFVARRRGGPPACVNDQRARARHATSRRCVAHYTYSASSPHSLGVLSLSLSLSRRLPQIVPSHAPRGGARRRLFGTASSTVPGPASASASASGARSRFDRTTTRAARGRERQDGAPGASRSARARESGSVAVRAPTTPRAAPPDASRRPRLLRRPLSPPPFIVFRF